MPTENLDEVLENYTELKKYINKLGDSKLSRLVADFEKKFLPYIRKNLGDSTLRKYDSVESKGKERSHFMRCGENREILEEWARLFVDDSEESFQALKLLRDAGFSVTTLPVSGLSGPELKLGTSVYRGLGEIQNLVKKLNSAESD